jgi:hypothetical protein
VRFEHATRACGKREPLAHPCVAQRLVALTQLDHPAQARLVAMCGLGGIQGSCAPFLLARDRRGQVQGGGRAPGAPGAERRRQGARGVDHHQVALRQQARQLVEAGVSQRAAGNGDDKKANPIAGQPAPPVAHRPRESKEAATARTSALTRAP